MFGRDGNHILRGDDMIGVGSQLISIAVFVCILINGQNLLIEVDEQTSLS